jgi:hypothetical protein
LDSFPSHLLKTAEQGAQTQVFLSASPSVGREQGGMYFDNSAPILSSTLSEDTALAKWLWGESERLTGVKYNLPNNN